MDNLTTEKVVFDDRREEAVSELMRNVYLWMTGGLALTGLVAWIVATSPTLVSLIFGSQIIFWGLLIAELVFVMILSAAIDKLSFGAASGMYTVYCVLNGATLSSIFLIYQLDSVAQIFFVTAGAFALLAAIGTFTKKDLSGLGTFLIIALGGLLIASVVGIVLGRPESIWMSVIGVIIFAGLTVYDAQKIRRLLQTRETVNEGNMKIALIGALTLYLDFINLLLRLLSLFGKRK